jgi:hypothetical protein
MSQHTRFTLPKPNHLVMRLSGTLNEWGLLFGIPLLRRVPLLRQIPPFGGYFKVNKIKIRRDDESTLRSVTSPLHAFFFGPNHPEFTTDWLIDKYISVRFAPRMSSWAASSIIRGPLSGFWSANNLIGNDGGEAAKEYSVQCAMNGDGTLLHPEGTVRWRSDKIFDLLPGIVDMAIDAAQKCKEKGLEKKVFIVPLVWKIVYDEDVRSRLGAAISQLENTLELPGTGSLPLGKRYVTFHQNLLLKQMKKFSSQPEGSPPGIDDAQRFFDSLFEELSLKYEVTGPKEEVHRILHRLYRKAKEAKNRRDADAVIELQRLAAYSRDTFEKKFFYQEEIGEGLQFIRQIFLTGGYDSVRSMLPKPFGWRTVHLRVPPPLEVSQRLSATSDRSILRSNLLDELKASMDRALYELNEESKERLKISVET